MKDSILETEAYEGTPQPAGCHKKVTKTEATKLGVKRRTCHEKRNEGFCTAAGYNHSGSSKIKKAEKTPEVGLDVQQSSFSVTRTKLPQRSISRKVERYTQKASE
jgi:hypothetical protein